MAKILFLKKLCLKKKGFHLSKSHLINFRKMKVSGIRSQREITTHIVQERTLIKVHGPPEMLLAGSLVTFRDLASRRQG